MSEKILTSLKRNCACGENKNGITGKRRSKPKPAARSTFFFICSSVLQKPIAKPRTRIGATILAVLNVYRERTKETAERINNDCFRCTASRKSQTPVTKKNVE